jgi:hemolysin activation/secretion protein
MQLLLTSLLASLPTLLLTLILAAPLVVCLPLAAQAAEVVPGAGSILQQIQPINPPAPSSNGTGLLIEDGGRTNLPPSAPFLVKSIQLSGNTVFDTAALHALVADAEGKNLTLSQLGDLAARLTDYYQSHGYPLARAIVPAQTIQAGAVRIQIIEARYGKIQLDNHSRVTDSLIGATLSPLQGGQAVAQLPLDHALLLLSDIPGVAISATLKPGDAVGTSDLQVDADATPAVTGNVALDNYGNRYTGRTRLAGTVDFIGPLHHGDVLSLTALSSGSGLNYGGLSYESLLDGRGTRLGASYTALHYELGDTLDALDGHGTAQVESLWLKRPFMRNRDINVYGQIQYDHKQLDDHIDTASIRTDRHLDNLTASLAGDLHDSVLSGSISTWNVGWTVGRVDFDDDTARQVDAATANARGSFSKWTANFFRLQSLSARDALYLTLSGQWANSDLDPAEKMVAGGPYTVRAYDIGAESGDTGILGSAEFRHELVQVKSGPLQAVAFFDAERVTVNHTAWIAGTNGVTLRGAGLGLKWAGIDQWRGRIYVAVPIGRTPELIGTNNSVHAWLEIGKGF